MGNKVVTFVIANGSVCHKILFILIYIVFKLTIPSLPSFSEIGISQLMTITSFFLVHSIKPGQYTKQNAPLKEQLLLKSITVHHESINHIWKSVLHYAALGILQIIKSFIQVSTQPLSLHVKIYVYVHFEKRAVFTN